MNTKIEDIQKQVFSQFKKTKVYQDFGCERIYFNNSELLKFKILSEDENFDNNLNPFVVKCRQKNASWASWIVKRDDIKTASTFYFCLKNMCFYIKDGYSKNIDVFENKQTKDLLLKIDCLLKNLKEKEMIESVINVDQKTVKRFKI